LNQQGRAISPKAASQNGRSRWSVVNSELAALCAEPSLPDESFPTKIKLQKALLQPFAIFLLKKKQTVTTPSTFIDF
jgi:hypothetical protein